jgi:hypothetical protein
MFEILIWVVVAAVAAIVWFQVKKIFDNPY